MIRLIRSAYHTFREHGLEDPFEETMRLLDILTSGELRTQERSSQIVTESDLDALARARKQDVPLEYALGYAVFMERLFRCDSGALIPREETELLARTAIRLARGMAEERLSIIDIGTGSGNLSVSLALELPSARVHASDISSEALAVAEANVGLYRLEARVRLYNGSLFEPFDGEGLMGAVDMVVCNPPYIPRASLAKMDPVIRDHEPREAFDGGDFGINVFRGLIAGSREYLRAGGLLVFEIGAGQERLVMRLLTRSGFDGVESFSDDQGVTRVLSARWNGAEEAGV